MLLTDDSPFWRWQAAYRPSVYLLALSGGRDSMALLQALTFAARVPDCAAYRLLCQSRLVGGGRGMGRILPT